jgi:hypothetical protein
VGQIPLARTPQNQRGNNMKHSKLHGAGMMGGQSRDSGKPRGGVYRDAVDEPAHQKIHHGEVSPMKDWHMMASCHDFKGESSDQAYGQAGEKGCKEDGRKIMAQAFHAYSDDTGF